MRAVAILALLLFPVLAAADPRIPILGDDLELSLPAGMKLEPRGHDIMSADAPSDDETRAVLDDGPERFVMMAYELDATTGPDFLAAVTTAAAVELPGAPVAALAMARPLVAIGATPPPTSSAEANPVYGAWIAGGDHRVQLLAFYANPAAAAHPERWVALARQIALSARAGTRVRAAMAGDRALESRLITVPDGWVLSSQPGPDFTVFHLRKIAPLGTQAPSCGIYFGGFASYQYKQAGIDAGKLTRVRAPLLGAPVDWFGWSAAAGVMTEAMVTSKAGDTVHVFCHAATQAELPALRAIAATLRAK